MKTFSLYLIFGLFLFGGCTDKDDEPENNLKGTWSLIRLSGTISGIENNYPTGAITWNFNDSNVIIINNDTEHEYDAFESGNYPYTLHHVEVGTDCTETISINEIDMGCYYFNNNELYINQLANDGVALKLVKL